MLSRLGLLAFATVIVTAAALSAPSRQPTIAAASQAEDSLTAAEVVEAYRLLLQHFVTPPDPVDLLQAGWNGALVRASLAGADASAVQPPQLSGQTPAEHETELQAAFERLAQATTASTHDLAYAAIDAMTDSLADRHTSYIPAETWSFGYVGDRWAQYTPAFLYRTVRRANGDIVVWDVVAGSRVDQAGIRPGDIIDSVNGLSAREFAPRPRRGENQLSVSRPGEPAREVSVEAEPESMRPFESRMLGAAAYFYLFSFTPLRSASGEDRFAENIRDELAKLASQRPEGWILDLRSNRGGNIPTLAFLAASFGYSDVVVAISRRSGSSRIMAEGAADVRAGARLVILVNGSSASASEILTATLQDAGIAHVIGTRTAGAGNAAARFPLQRGGGLSITTGLVKAGLNGRTLEAAGVTPDEVVPLNLASIYAGGDNQLERAIDYLRGVPAPDREPALQAP